MKELALLKSAINRFNAYPQLTNALTALKEGELLGFIKNFENAGNDVLSLLNKDVSLLDEWKALATAAEREAFVENLKVLANGTGIKVIDDFLKTHPNISTITDANLPKGYKVFTMNGRKYIKRTNVNDLNTPRLMVDKAGTIVLYTKPQRLANSNKLRANLEKHLGSNAPDNHQAHHIVASNVVENSALHQEAIKRGLYDVDRAENGKFLASTDEDLLLPRASTGFPTHNGPHPIYDVTIRDEIIAPLEETMLIKYGSLDKIPDNDLSKALDLIESESLNKLKNWTKSKLN